MNIFEIATRNKYRFNFKGQLSVEDLWDLNVTALDSIYKILNKQLKEAQEDSLLSAKTKENETLETQIEIVKYIVSVKQQEVADKLLAKERKEKKQRIMEIMEKKDNEALENMSKEELQKMLADME